MQFDEEYWDKRYEENETGWDIGYASPPLTNYFDTIEDKNLKILIPGSGNAWEGDYLWKNGFTNFYLCDISEHAIENFKKRIPGFPSEKLIHADFFKLNEKYDLIVEQTFFCALHPSQRKDYVKKMHELLKPGGRLVGLLFNDKLNEDHPPFGGNEKEYRELFSPYFNICKMETASNSIKPRMGRELFIILEKKETL